MEFLLPNEIARLVYGYLEEQGCASAAKIFLETCPHLTESKNCAAKGRRFNTKVLGLGLIDMLELLAEVTCYIKSIEKEACKGDAKLGEILNQLKSTLKLGNPDETVNKPVYLRFTVPSRSKKKKSKHPEVSPSHPKNVRECPQESSGSPVVPNKKKPKQPEVSTLQPKVVLDSSQNPVEESPKSSVVPNQSHALQVLLENKALHEKLAENINKVVANKSEADSLERILEKKIVETIVNTTEKDPIFQEMLEELVGPVEATNSTPEDTEIENEDAAGRLQSGVVESQHFPAGGRNIVEEAMENFCVATGSVPVLSHQVLPVPTTSFQSSHQPQPLLPLVNRAPLQTAAPHGLGYSSLAVPRTPVASSLSPQPTITQSYVFTTASGLATISSALSPLPEGGSHWSQHHVSSPVVQATPSSNKLILPKPPTQSTIKVLHPKGTPYQPMTGSILQGILQNAPVDTSKSARAIEPAAMNAQVPRVAPYPDSTPSKLRVSPTVSSSVRVNPPSRVGGVRTRGGKTKAPNTYPGPKTLKKGSTLANNPPTPDVSNPSEVPMKGETELQAPDPNTLSISVPEPREKFDSILETHSVDTIDNNVISAAQDVSPVEKDVTSMDKEVASTNSDVSVSNTSEPPVEVSNNPQITVGASNAPERPDTTPLQGSEPNVKLRKRLSLSTPRKGSHIRTLEFKTPPKSSLLPRKSLSSPKQRVAERSTQMHKMLESVKKSELFKSPPKKEARSWDADLRSVISDPCEDIPTSVGLMRKDPDLPTNRRKNPPSKIHTLSSTESTPKTPESTGKSETNEDLMTRIKRDVLDVIDEEDISLNNKSSDSVDSSKTRSPVKSPGTGSLLEIGDIGVPPSTIKKLYSKRHSFGDENSSTLDSPISKAPRENFLLSPSRPQTPGLGVVTPSKIGKSPENALLNTPGSVSLEATLIMECTRIENEFKENTVKDSIFESEKDIVFDEKSSVDNAGNSSGECLSTEANLLPPPKGILVLKTPAKSTIPVPVEMTPLSKIINEETRLGNCTLLTPTIPPTPDLVELKNEELLKTEDKVSPTSVPSSQDKPPSAESPKASKKSPKTSTKTPLVRLKQKDPKASSSKSKATSKKKGKTTEIDCNQLIAQCLKEVKVSVYGACVPDTEDESQSVKTTGRKSPVGRRKTVHIKKKVAERKKPKSDAPSRRKKAKESPKSTTPIFSFGEHIQRYESQHNSSSDDDSEMAKWISNKAREISSRDSQNNLCQPDTGAQTSKVDQVDDVVSSSNNDGAPSQKIKTVEDIKSPDSQHADAVADVAKVNEVGSPVASPDRTICNSQMKMSTENIDLDTYSFKCALLTDDGTTVETVLRTTPFLDLYTFPLVSVVPKPGTVSSKSTNSGNSNDGDKHEKSRRRKRSGSRSDEERESKGWKRKRFERSYEITSRTSPKRRGRGIPRRGMHRQNRGRTYRAEFRDRHSDRQHFSRRPSRKYSSSSDEDRRRRSKSSSGRSSSYLRDRSRSRPASDGDDCHPSDRSRSSKKHEHSTSASWKERPKTPTNVGRRGDRDRWETRLSSSFRQDVKAERVQPTDPLPKKLRSHVELPPVRGPEKREPIPADKEKPKFVRPQQPDEYEEGEISETSQSTVLSFSKNSPHFLGASAACLSSPAADENRQALLQRVGVDQLLCIVHGEDKS